MASLGRVSSLLARLVALAPPIDIASCLPPVSRLGARAVHSSRPLGLSANAAPPAECIAPKPVPPLGTYSQHFPDTVWSRISNLFPYRHSHPTLAINVRGQADKGLVVQELEHRGVTVVDVALDPLPSHARCCLQATAEQAGRDSTNLNRADLVAFLHIMHLLDHDRAAQAAYRHLKPGGYMAVVWNDRDRRSRFGRELDELLTSYSAAYSPLQSYRGLLDWGQKLQAGHLFELREHSRHPFELRLHSAGALMNAVEGLSLHSLSPGISRQLRSSLADLAKKHFGSEGSIQLPLESKLFLLNKLPEEHSEALQVGRVPRNPGLPPPAHAPRSWDRAGMAGFTPEKHCLFCRSPVAD